jgi:hypothetical protein
LTFFKYFFSFNITFLFYLEICLSGLLHPLPTRKTTLEREGRICGPCIADVDGCLTTNSFPYLADIHAAVCENEEEHMSRVSH